MRVDFRTTNVFQRAYFLSVSSISIQPRNCLTKITFGSFFKSLFFLFLLIASLNENQLRPSLVPFLRFTTPIIVIGANVCDPSKNTKIQQPRRIDFVISSQIQKSLSFSPSLSLFLFPFLSVLFCLKPALSTSASNLSEQERILRVTPR